MQKRQDNTALAILISIVALVLFDLMGVLIKYLSASYSAVELSAYRNVFGLIPSFIALWMTASWHQNGRTLAVRQWRLAMLRGVAVTFAQLMFYMSLGLMAFATATTISYSTALFTTALAVPLLGERVGLVRWSAVAIGFVGVLLITRPGADAFAWSALLPISAAALYAFTAVTARLVDDDVPTPLFNLYSSATAAVGAIVLALLFSGFSQITSLRDLGLIALMGAFGGSAVLCLVVSFRMTEPSNLAPFTYFGIPIAFAFGWLFFSEAPIDDLFPGALLLVGGGLLIIYRERRISRVANRASINPGYQSIDTEFSHTKATPQFDKSRKV